jgi:ferredoxin
VPRVRIEGGGEPFDCDADTALLVVMRQRGLAEIPIGCRRGGCGVCKVRVVEGRFRSAKMSRAHITLEEQKAGWVLACRIYPETDLVIERGPSTTPTTIPMRSPT